MDGNDTILNLDKDLEIKALRGEIERLKNEVTKYKILMKEADLEIKDGGISDEEIIAVQELSKLREISESPDRELTLDDTRKFDILHKNLKLARGENTRVGKKSLNDKSDKELMEMLKK